MVRKLQKELARFAVLLCLELAVNLDGEISPISKGPAPSGAGFFVTYNSSLARYCNASATCSV